MYKDLIIFVILLYQNIKILLQNCQYILQKDDTKASELEIRTSSWYITNMFTGLIEETGPVKLFEKTPSGAVLTVECKKILEDVKLGASIAINGACHTVVDFSQSSITVQTSNETLAVSNFSALRNGSIVNLERAMTLSSRLDGHLVSGHIDGTAIFLDRVSDGFSNKLFFKIDEKLKKYIIYKGSITVNGISLTIASIDDATFSVEIIPHTMINTNLGQLKVGDIVNIETDIIAKYIEKFSHVGNNTTKITKSFLEENGFI